VGKSKMWHWLLNFPQLQWQKLASLDDHQYLVRVSQSRFNLLNPMPTAAYCEESQSCDRKIRVADKYALQRAWWVSSFSCELIMLSRVRWARTCWCTSHYTVMAGEVMMNGAIILLRLIILMIPVLLIIQRIWGINNSRLFLLLWERVLQSR